MRYQIELASQALFDEILPLLHLHHNEVAAFKDIPLDPDWDAYLSMQSMGILRVFTARDGLGALVGYASFVVMPNPHYRTSLQATCDAIFVHPTQRGRFVGAGLLSAVHERLKQEGVVVIHLHASVDYDLESLLARAGYKLIEKNYAARLEPAS